MSEQEPRRTANRAVIAMVLLAAGSVLLSRCTANYEDPTLPNTPDVEHIVNVAPIER